MSDQPEPPAAMVADEIDEYGQTVLEEGLQEGLIHDGEGASAITRSTAIVSAAHRIRGDQ